MKSNEEVKDAIDHLRAQFHANADRQLTLSRSTRAVDWKDSEEGKEFVLLQAINDEIMAVITGMSWVVDDLSISPFSQRVEQIMSPKKHILHAGGE